MDFKQKLQFSGIATSVLFLWFYGLAVVPPVRGQYEYETPNHLCGGHFRFFTGSIKFNHTELTDPNPGTQKVCVWQIIPSPTYPSLQVSVSNYNLTTNEKLGITGFTEFNQTLFTKTITGNETFIAYGDLLVVILVSDKIPARNATDDYFWGFQLTWDRFRPEDMRNNTRFVVPSNTYGKLANNGPYDSRGFMGNSLSTFAFPKGNDTDGFVLRLEFWSLVLQSDPNGTDWQYDCPFWPGTNGPPGGFCNTFFVNQIEPNGLLTTLKMYNNETVEGDIYTSNYGLFMVMWGGNRFNGTGGGRWTYEYQHVRA